MAYEPSPEEMWQAEQQNADRIRLLYDREMESQQIALAARETILKKQRDDERARRIAALKAGPPKLRTYDEVLRDGVKGVDFMPHQSCPTCGGMPFFNGRRMVEHHDLSQHPPSDNIRYADSPSYRSGSGLSRIDPTQIRGVRRTSGDSDE